MSEKSRGRSLLAAKGILILTLSGLAVGPVTAGEVDLGKAVVVSPGNLSKQEKKAVTLLLEEVQKRTLIRWEIASTWPTESVPVIAVGHATRVTEFAGPYATQLASQRSTPGAEGYQIQIKKSDANAPAVFVIGSDSRGVLFGLGRLLREMHLTRGKITVADDLSISTAPKFPIRGHQPGYRPKTKSYFGFGFHHL